MLVTSWAGDKTIYLTFVGTGRPQHPGRCWRTLLKDNGRPACGVFIIGKMIRTRPGGSYSAFTTMGTRPARPRVGITQASSRMNAVQIDRPIATRRLLPIGPKMGPCMRTAVAPDAEGPQSSPVSYGATPVLWAARDTARLEQASQTQIYRVLDGRCQVM